MTDARSNRHPWYSRLRSLIDEREARAMAGDRYARWVNENTGHSMRVGGISVGDRIRLAIAVMRLP